MIIHTNLGNHTIYGGWDDVSGTQILVYWPPAGDTCTVFTMAGMDYGGGIQSYSEDILISDIRRLEKDCKSNYEFYRAVEKLVDDRR